MHKVTVIIPWYKYTGIIRCLRSISNSINPKIHKILVIDDCTSDFKLTSVVKDYCDLHSFHYFRNEVNIGYTSSAKNGMLTSTSDVLLLNSDTIVTKGFLNKLSFHAYSDNKIATVTPMSNQTNLFSLKCDNLLRLPHGVAIINTILEIMYRKKSCQVFSGHGFCLYIKREVINKVGYLDDITYPITYCEENDYCLRCSRQGYNHVVALDTFIYHQGRGTHGDAERESLLSVNYPRLLEKYPEIPSLVADYEKNKPLQSPQNLVVKIDKIAELMLFLNR